MIEIAVEPFDIVTADLFGIDLYTIGSGDESIYNPMITFFIHDDTGDIKQCFTLTTQITGLDKFEVTRQAFEVAFNFTPDFISDINLYDDDGNEEDFNDFDLDDIWDSFNECECGSCGEDDPQSTND